MSILKRCKEFIAKNITQLGFESELLYLFGESIFSNSITKTYDNIYYRNNQYIFKENILKDERVYTITQVSREIRKR